MFKLPVNDRSAALDKDHLEWLDHEMVPMVNEFVNREKLLKSAFIKGLNHAFNSQHFTLLLKKWLIDYFLDLFSLLDAYSGQPGKELSIEDNPVNRYACGQYCAKFNKTPVIRWLPERSRPRKLLVLILTISKVGLSAVKKGIRLSSGTKHHKVMREAIWGLFDKGRYFHDNFMVDGNLIKDQDLLIYSRGVPPFSLRLFAYNDARKSDYAFFNLEELPLSLPALFRQIIPKYLKAGSEVLWQEVGSKNYSLYLNVFAFFCSKAVPYEKIFANYKIGAELGHNYYSASHIPEAIVCQSHGAKYYLMHWSDNSTRGNRYVSAFLACDKYFLWGRAHIQGNEGEEDILCPIGYVFKQFVNESAGGRESIIAQIGFRPDSKIVSFFDESFGGDTGMLEEHHMNLWRTALELARQRPDITVIIKPKIDVKYFAGYSRYSKDGLEKFTALYAEIIRHKNVRVMAPAEWSFIEIIGISDVVVTMGMTSSATIALICGKEGLYFHESYYYHPFVSQYKDRLVFNDPAKLIAMINSIFSGEESPRQSVSEEILREYDAYPDNKGIERLREMLA